MGTDVEFIQDLVAEYDLSMNQPIEAMLQSVPPYQAEMIEDVLDECGLHPGQHISTLLGELDDRDENDDE